MITKTVLENYKDYGKVLNISNGIVEVYVTLDVGPRIIRFGFLGGQNMLSDTRSDYEPKTDAAYQEFWGKGRAWENFGGHRIWATKEVYPETYAPDDQPVNYTLTENGGVFDFADEPTGLKKQLEIKMDPDDTNLQVINRVKNIGKDLKEFSVWSITVCNKNGTLLIPMNTKDTGLLANRIISVWPYTDLQDGRIKFFDKYVTLKQSAISPRPIKLGFDLEAGNVFYTIGNDVFVKSFEAIDRKKEYPDGGCSFETYDCDVMCEVETLGPVTCVEAGQTAEHIERWSLLKKPDGTSLESEEKIEEFLKLL